MANIRVKDLPNTDTLADADELIVDSSSAGTRRVSYSELKTEVAADYVAAPSTYKVATLASDNKLDPSQVPDTLSQGLNFVGNANSAGDLTSTTQGDFYIIQTAFGVYSVGDQAVYDGSAYVRVTDGTKQIAEGGTGATTLSQAQINLKIGNIGTRPQDIPLNSFLNSGAYLDFDAFYETGTWTPTLSFGGGSTGWTYSSQEGYYTKIGNIAFIRGLVWVNAKGTSTGAAKIEGLPLAASSLGSASNVIPVIASSMLGLTSGVTALFDDGGTAMSLFDAGSSGATGLNDTNFNGGEILRFSGTYQIA